MTTTQSLAEPLQRRIDQTTSGRLNGKVALVTGASSGIGRATATLAVSAEQRALDAAVAVLREAVAPTDFEAYLRVHKRANQSSNCQHKPFKPFERSLNN
jgi:hypothetical protein